MNRRIIEVLAAAVLVASAPQAFAQTSAGVTVHNVASVSFKVGGTVQTAPPDGTADFKVDRKIDLSVSEIGTNTTSAAPLATNAALAFQVTNSSNDYIDIALAATRGSIGTSASGTTSTELLPTTTTYSYYSDDVDADDATPGVDGDADGKINGVLDANDIALTGSYLDQVAPGDNVTVFVVASALPGLGAESDPDKVQDGDLLAVKLTGTARSAYANQRVVTFDGTGLIVTPDGTGSLGSSFADDTATADDSTKVENVFADGADTDSSDVAGNGQDSSYDVYEIASATISVNKQSAVIWDPLNGTANPKAIPGAVVLYCIAVSNSGGQDAGDVTISDDIPANTSFVDKEDDVDADTGTTIGVDTANSLRFGTATTCTAADWSAAGTAGGDAIEDSTDDDTGDTVNFGYYDSVSATKKITTTVTSLSKQVSSVDGVTTTMFLVKIL
jgi:uncharacterized repeat protein (TIGR01451 family)